MATFEELRQQVQGGQPVPQVPVNEEGIRRERGIGMPTVGALGALALSIAAARSPAGRKFLDSVWQKPLGAAERWSGGRPIDVRGIGRPGLPSELPMLHARPESTLVSDFERIGSNLAREGHGYFEKPFVKEFTKTSPDVIKDIEHSQVSNFLTRLATGLPHYIAKQQTLASAPQWFQEAQAYRSSMLAAVNGAKDFMGLPRIPERLGPYWARQAIKDEALSLRGKSGMFGELRTSVGPGERERVYSTMRRGEATGVQYEDPRVAQITRDLNDLRVVETSNFMRSLEGNVAFRTEAQAQAIAGPGRKVYSIEPLPGAPKWYVPYAEEAKFLKDNLENADGGKMAFLGSWANAVARNPNLINPLPHIVKNMAFKFRQAGGKLSSLPGDYLEFRRGTSPDVVMFKQWMPFDETGMTAAEQFNQAIHGIRRENYPAVVRLADLAMDATIGRTHRASSKLIFSQADPAMRFSLWKNYLHRGATPAEAAQNVWIDLIRYGTRSTVVDAWKSIPFNFFVPWRLGTATSLYKNITNHPFRTAAFIGAIDLIREIRYRKTGRWTHLPIDYIEQPIAQIIQSKDPKDAAKSLLAATLATVAFGPGGGFAAATLIDVLKDVQMTGDWGRLRNVFWGLSQLVDGGKSGASIIRDIQSGNHAKAAQDATNLMATLATAEHTALNYRPRRLMAALPETGPWLAKSIQVKTAESMQDAAERMGERAGARREIRKGRTIEDRVRSLTETP